LISEYDDSNFKRDIHNLLLALIRPFIAPLPGQLSANRLQAERMFESGDMKALMDTIFPKSKGADSTSLDFQILQLLMHLWKEPLESKQIQQVRQLCPLIVTSS
jgi:hypothetical protein